MQLHQLQRNKKSKRSKRVGRGGKRGKTAGRGHKGQKARAGHRIRPEIRDAIKKMPKLRGHGINRAQTVNSSKVKPTPVNLSALEENFSNGDEVTPKTLINSGLVNKRKGRIPAIKILGTGKLSKKIIVSGIAISESAKEKIEKAGGKIK